MTTEPNGPFQNETVNTVHRFLTRYQPFIITVIAIALIAAFLPGRGGDDASDTASDLSGVTDFGDVAAGDTTDTQTDTGDTSGGSIGGGEQVAAPPPPGVVTFQEAQEKGLKLDFGLSCDTSKGRVKVPSVYAPPCVPKFSGNNGGNTWKGVTADKIRIVRYSGEANPAAEAIVAAAGADDSDEEVDATYAGYAEYLESHYQTYGRKLEIIKFQGGADDDEVAAKANGKKVSGMNVFASWGGPASTNAYVDELVKGGVVCLCTASQPIETYLERAPYVWSTLMASSQLYIHRAEFVGKRLKGGKAEHAGDTAFQLRDRTYAVVYFETAEGAYKAGVDFFVKELRDKYGVTLTDRIAVTGAHLDPAAAQEEAPGVATRLKAKGITSVLFAGDPLYPIFLTKEATKQNYFPEWIITGSVLSDTSFFARTYDQAQWANAFGVSALGAGLPEELGESYRLYEWHHGEPPPAEASHGVIFPNPWLFFTGVHMAGPALTPKTFQAGMFAYPRSGGGPTAPSSSFGKGLYPWDDYLRYDDTSELWWDSDEVGEDETGTRGVGMYKFMDGGKRYLPHKRSTAPPKAFIEEGAVSIYDQHPNQDKPPTYKHQDYKPSEK